MIVSEAHCSLQRREYYFILFFYFDPSKPEGKVDRRLMWKSINKNTVIFAIIIFLKSYINTKAPISYTTRNNTEKRDWNSSLRHNCKRFLPTWLLSSKMYYSSVSDQLYVHYMEYWWIRLNIIITSIHVSKLTQSRS